MEQVKADILLATYNGEAFLEEQLQSILDQSYKAWHLYIRDDGSSDGTVAIIKQFTDQFPDCITWIIDDKGSLGASGNFSRLMEVSTAPYILFSDQDDVWEPEKTEILLNEIRKLEEQSNGLPTYVFSDLAMIDDDGNSLAHSLWKKENIDPSRIKLNQLLVQNVPYGCSTAINRKLLELATPVDPRALLHDHWMALLAAASGKIGPVRRTTILHRIHDSNASRSNNPIRLARDKSTKSILANKNFNRYFDQLGGQALAVKERLLDRNYSNAPYDVLDDFINLRAQGLFTRKYRMIKRRFFKHSRLQTIKWLLRI